VSCEVGVSAMAERIAEFGDAPVWTPDAISVATRDWFTYLGASKAMGAAS
jgi:hypothetical protein